MPYQATYAASKAFVLSFSKALAYETMGTGVRISVVVPGVVATKLHDKAGSQNSRYLYWFPHWTPEEVASLAYRRFKRGWSVTMPGIGNKLGAFVMRFVPDFLLIPLMGWFFRVRDDEGRVLWPGGALTRAPKRKPAWPDSVGAARPRSARSPGTHRRKSPGSRPENIRSCATPRRAPP